MLQQQECNDDDEDGYPKPRYKQTDSTTGRMAKRASGMNTLGSTKRPNGWNQDSNGHSKKMKTDISLAPQLGVFEIFPTHQ